jgi:hypothetical protein
MNKVKHKLRRGAIMKVNNGKNTLFWEDVWMGELPLKLTFPRLYEYCGAKNCLVSECCKGEWYMDFRRPLSSSEAAQWEMLVDKLEDIQLNEGRDKMIWNPEKSGCYTSKSMYRCLSHQGVINKRMIRLWKSKLPMKLKSFMWLVSQDRLQTKLNLKRRNWRGKRTVWYETNLRVLIISCLNVC